MRLIAGLSVVLAVFAGVASASADPLPAVYLSPQGSDSAPCTAAAPCRSFARGYSASPAGGLVLLGAGDYGDQALSDLPAKGSPANVVLRPAVPGTVTVGDLRISGTDSLEVAGVTARDGWEVLDGASHVTLRDIVTTDAEAGGYISGADDVQVLGGEIGRIDPGDGLHLNNGYGENTDILIDGLFIHDLTRNRDPSSHDDCIQAGSATHLVIRDSRFFNCGTQGVFLNPYAGGVTRDVLLENNWMGDAQLGYYILYVGDATDVMVRNDTFTGLAHVDSRASRTSLIGNILAGGDAYDCGVLADNAVQFAYNVTPGRCGDATNTVDARAADFLADPAAWDLHLKAGAKAIDRGDPASFPATDFDGHARPFGLAPDAGAIEFGSVLPPGGAAPTPSGSPASPGQGGASLRAPAIRTPAARVAVGDAFVVSGTAPPGTRVELFANGSRRATILAPGGRWRRRLTGVAYGTILRLSARAVDGQGGTSRMSRVRVARSLGP